MGITYKPNLQVTECGKHADCETTWESERKVVYLDKNFVSDPRPFHTTPHTLNVMCFGRGRFEADAR